MNEPDSQKRGQRLVKLIWAANGLLVLLIILGLFLWPAARSPDAEAGKNAEQVIAAQDTASEPNEAPKQPDAPLTPVDEQKLEKPGAALVMVVVGLGNNKNEADWLKKVDYPLALSLVPMRSGSAGLAAMAKKRGWVTMAHIPMEPLDSNEIDHQACLISDMKRDELRTELNKMLNSLPEVYGVSNHQGAKLTARPKIMEAFSEICAEKQLFILDNKNSGSSYLYKKGLAAGVPVARRDIYLDGDGTRGDEASLKAQLNYAHKMALREERPVVVVAHAYEATLKFLPQAAETIDLTLTPIISISDLFI